MSGDPDTGRPMIGAKDEPLLPRQYASFYIQNPKKQPTPKLALPASPQSKHIYPQGPLYPRFLSFVGACIRPFLLLCGCCASCTTPIIEVKSNEEGLLETFGSYTALLSPGIHVLNPLSERAFLVNRQTLTVAMEQTVMSRDNISAQIHAVVFYRVSESADQVYGIGQSADECVKEMAIASIRFAVGQSLFQTLIEDRLGIGNQCRDDLNRSVRRWGLYVQIVSVKEIVMSLELTRQLSCVAQTKKEMEAMLINCRGEMECARLLSEKAMLLETASAMNIRYLSTVGEITAHNPDALLILRTERK